MGRMDRMNLSDKSVVWVNVEVAAFTNGPESCLDPVHPQRHRGTWMGQCIYLDPSCGITERSMEK